MKTEFDWKGIAADFGIIFTQNGEIIAVPSAGLNYSIRRMANFIGELRLELEESARLHGMGASREARLLAQVEESQKEIARLRIWASDSHVTDLESKLGATEAELDATCYDLSRAESNCSSNANSYLEAKAELETVESEKKGWIRTAFEASTEVGFLKGSLDDANQTIEKLKTELSKYHDVSLLELHTKGRDELC